MSVYLFCVPGMHAGPLVAEDPDDILQVAGLTGWAEVPATKASGHWVYDAASPAKIVRCEHHKLPGEPGDN